MGWACILSLKSAFEIPILSATLWRCLSFRAAGRDRTAARTTLGGEFPALALSIREVGSSFHHGPRFRRPPCDPGRWDFPSPVLTLAFLRSPSHTARSSSADPPTPRHSMVCFPGRSIVLRPSIVRVLLKLPSAQSPLARSRCDLARRDLLDPVSRRYPAFIAPTGSCANPPPSSCLGCPLTHQVCAGCCQPLLGGGPSRRALCPSFSACLDPYPGGSRGALARFYPQDNGLSDMRTRSALHNTRTATSVRNLLRGCSHSLMFRPADLLATQIAPTAVPYSTGQLWLLRPRLSRFVTSPSRGYAHRPLRATDGRGTFTLQDAQPCRLLP